MERKREDKGEGKTIEDKKGTRRKKREKKISRKRKEGGEKVRIKKGREGRERKRERR